MKSLNLNPKRSAILLSLLLVSEASLSSTILIFDNPKLVILDDRKRITGYYSSTSADKYVFRCEFVFVSTGKFSPEGGMNINAWRATDRMPAESRLTTGTIFEAEDGAVLQLDSVPQGCLFGSDGDIFLATVGNDWKTAIPIQNQGLKVKYIRGQKSIGIRLIRNNGSIYSFDGTRHSITSWSPLVLMKNSVDGQQVRFIDPASSAVIEGTFKGSLINPFSIKGKFR